MKKIFNIQSDQYVPISSGRNYVFRQYDSIYSFLKRNFNEDLANTLSQPIPTTDGVSFYTLKIGSYQPFEDFSTDIQRQLLIKYNALLHTIHRKCSDFEKSNDPDYISWSETLRTVFNHDSNLLFSDGNNLAIVWGWKFRLKENYFLPFEAFSHTLSEGNTPINDAEIEDLNSTIEEEEIIEVQGNIDADAAQEEITGDSIKIESPAEEKVEETFIPPLNTIKQSPIVHEKNWFFKFLDAFERFAKKYWWLILILILLIICFFLLKGCDQKPISAAELSLSEQEEIYNQIMPDQPRHNLLPIDTSKIIDDEDSYSQILSNVVNVALKNKAQNFKHFSIDLKNAFENESYKIVYYDDETSRLQFTFPEEERFKIKQNIQEKMAKYQLLIWDETVFESSRALNDPVFQNQEKGWYFKAINTEKAWDLTMGDTSVVIAIIDDGFDLDHVEFRNRIVHRYNIVNDDTRITSGPDRMHGTHVAGIALAAGGNGKGSSGIAPGCKLMPIQAAGEQGYFSMTDIIDGILYAVKNGADVINMSLGKQFSEEMQFLTPGEMDEISRTKGLDEADFWKELFQIAEDNNVTVVVAGGNQNLLVGLDPMQRSKQVIKVAATDDINKKASFSNFFRRSDSDCFISSPGVQIYSTLPGNSYGFMDGTSMASPIVAGAIGLMKSINPRLTNTQIRKILRNTAMLLADRRIAPLIQVDKAVKMARKN